MQHVGAPSPTGNRTPRPPALGARSLSLLCSVDNTAGHPFVPLLTHTFFPARGSRERAEPRAGRFQSVSVPPDQAPTTGCCRASLVVLGGEGPSIAGKFLDGAVFPGVGRWNIHFLFFRLPSSLKILLLRKADLTSLCLCRVLGARGPRFPLQPSQRGNPGLGWPPLDLGRVWGYGGEPHPSSRVIRFMVYVTINKKCRAPPTLPRCFGPTQAGGERFLQQDRKLSPAGPPTCLTSLAPTCGQTKGVG